MIEINLHQPEPVLKKNRHVPLIAAAILVTAGAVATLLMREKETVDATSQPQAVAVENPVSGLESDPKVMAALAKLDAEIKKYDDGLRAHLDWEQQNPELAEVEEYKSIRETWKTRLRDETEKKRILVLAIARAKQLEAVKGLLDNENRSIRAELDSSKTHTIEALLAGLALTIGGIVGAYKIGRRKTQEDYGEHWDTSLLTRSLPKPTPDENQQPSQINGPVPDFDNILNDPKVTRFQPSIQATPPAAAEPIEDLEDLPEVPTIIVEEGEMEAFDGIENEDQEDEDEQEGFDAAKKFMDKNGAEEDDDDDFDDEEDDVDGDDNDDYEDEEDYDDEEDGDNEDETPPPAKTFMDPNAGGDIPRKKTFMDPNDDDDLL